MSDNHPQKEDLAELETTDQRGAVWPAWVCLICYLVFLIGFWPLSMSRDFTDFSHFGPIEYMFSVLLILVVVLYPIEILFRPVGKLGRITLTILMQGLLVLCIPIALVIWIFSSTSAGTIALFSFIGLFATVIILQSALNNGGAVFRFWTATSCVALLTVGGWSIASGIIMVRQASHLAAGGPLLIVLRGQNYVKSYTEIRLTDPKWYQLRGANFSAYSDQGFEFRHLHFHSRLYTQHDRAKYNWSKKSMRFDLRE